MSDEPKYDGSCFCGEVKFTVTGKPEAMAYCHCASCRKWSAGPVNAFTLWKPTSVLITHGLDNINQFDKNPLSTDETIVSNRVWCNKCGGHVYIDHPTMGLIDVPASLINEFKFTPEFHVHYQESTHQMKDGLTKFKDLPKEAGGSGEELAE